MAPVDDAAVVAAFELHAPGSGPAGGLLGADDRAAYGQPIQLAPSHGSLSLNRSLMAAGLVDRVQVTLFPVISGQTGDSPIFRGAADFDLDLIENRTLGHHIQELIYRPSLH